MCKIKRKGFFVKIEEYKYTVFRSPTLLTGPLCLYIGPSYQNYIPQAVAEEPPENKSKPFMSICINDI